MLHLLHCAGSRKPACARLARSFFLALLLLFNFVVAPGSALFAQTDSTYTPGDTIRAQALLERARQHISAQNPDSALADLERAGQLFTQALGTGNRWLALVQYEQGLCFLKKADYPRALELAQQALATQVKLFGALHTDVSQTFSLLGRIYNARARKNQLPGFYREPPRPHPSGAPAGAYYTDVQLVLENKADYEQALDFLQKALTVQRSLDASESLTTARIQAQLGNLFRDMQRYAEARAHYASAQPVLQQRLGENHPEIAGFYDELTVFYQATGQHEQALDYGHRAESIWRRQAGGAEHPALATTYLNLAVNYQEKGDYMRAAPYYQKLIGAQPDLSRPEVAGRAAAYRGLGLMALETGNAEQAAGYFQKALDELRAEYPAGQPALAPYYADLGAADLATGNYDQAIANVRQTLDIWAAEAGATHPLTAQAYCDLGQVYYAQKKFIQAIASYQRALDLNAGAFDAAHPAVISGYQNLGTAYQAAGNYSLALEHYEQAYARARQAEAAGARYAELPGLLRAMAATHNAQGQFQAGEPYFGRALDALGYQRGRAFSNAGQATEALETLRQKADFYQNWYAQSRNLEHLRAAYGAAREADAAIGMLRRFPDHPQRASTLATNAEAAYRSAAAAGAALYRITDSLEYMLELFEYSERSKSLLLYQTMREAQAFQFAGIPDSLLRREYDLRVTITYYEKKRQAMLYEQHLPETDTSVLLLSGKLFNLHQAYQALKKHCENRYPDYFRLKYDLAIPSIADVQAELLQPGQTLLEYFITDSSIFLFVLTSTAFNAVDIKKDFPLEDWVRRLRRMLTDSVFTGPAVYCDLAHRLWQKLLQPVQGLLSEQLIIIPDGVLGYLPFEALLTAPAANPLRFQHHRYLLRDHRVSYGYSATLLREMLYKQHRQPPTERLLAMAPFFKGDVQALLAQLDTTAGLSVRTNNGELKPLPASGAEVAAIARLFGAQPLFNQAASLEAFHAQAGSKQMLHLSTHGQADDRLGDYAYLAFSLPGTDEAYAKLYARDLYNLYLNADLVVLSACETGAGKLQRGQGIISLAQAFTYAGARCIVTSLWKVADMPTKDLMLEFYTQLKKGLPKDEALRQAKLEYLNAAGQTRAHPFYWAGFVGIGDMRRLGL